MVGGIEISANSKYFHKFGDICFDPFRRLLKREGQEEVRLQQRTAEVLQYLIDNRDRIVPRDEIMAKIWGITVSVTDGSLDFQINKLRGALADDAASPKYIKTVKTKGIQFISSVITVQGDLAEELSKANSEQRSTTQTTPVDQVATAVVGHPGQRRRRWIIAAASVAALSICLVIGLRLGSRSTAPIMIDDLAVLSAPTMRADGRIQLYVKIVGRGFDPVNVEVLAVGPGCPRFGNCIVPNNVLGGVTRTLIERVPLGLGVGDYQIFLRNGPAGQPSNSMLLTVRTPGEH